MLNRSSDNYKRCSFQRFCEASSAAGDLGRDAVCSAKHLHLMECHRAASHRGLSVSQCLYKTSQEGPEELSQTARAAAGPVGCRVVVFSCGSLGVKAAERILLIPGVSGVSLVRAPYRTVVRQPTDKLARALCYSGIRGVTRAVWHFIREDAASSTEVTPLGHVPKGINVLEVADFHDPDCIEAIRRLDADLGVIVGTYILKPVVYDIPRLGSINLHTGKAPEYRGSAPGFWEMYNGERSVGVTVHRVEPSVDSGPILRQEVMAFDPAPPGDPLVYIRRFRAEQLEPAGLRLLAEAVADIVNNRVVEVAQDPANAHTYRMPTHRQKAELRRRVRGRREDQLRILKSVVAALRRTLHLAAHLGELGVLSGFLFPPRGRCAAEARSRKSEEPSF